MKYYIAKFIISGADGEIAAAVRDVLSAMAGEVGFEAFEDTEEGLNGYVQRDVLDRRLLDAAIVALPFENIKVSYTIEEAEDKDYNATWEEAGFEPIVINDRIVIHDNIGAYPCGHPSNVVGAYPCGRPLRIQPIIDITIDAKQAFGTGTHETTQMIIGWLDRASTNDEVRMDNVLDCGCGTGILSIAASKLGARHILAYDIDEWSVSNTRHNAELNGCGNIDVMHGKIDGGRIVSLSGRPQGCAPTDGRPQGCAPTDGRPQGCAPTDGRPQECAPTDARTRHVEYTSIDRKYDLILANLNRNILLNDMPAMAGMLASGGRLVMSGFYGADHGLLLDKAHSIGLILDEMQAMTGSDWCMLVVVSADAQ